MNTTSSVMRPSTVSRSPARLAAIQVATSSRMARSSSVMALPPSPLRPQHRLQDPRHRDGCCLRRLGIVADERREAHAFVLVGEGRLGGVVDERAAVAFAYGDFAYRLLVRRGPGRVR